MADSEALCNQLHSGLGALQYQIGVFRMFRQVLGNRRAYNVDLEALLPGPFQRGVRQFRAQPLATKGRWHFTMDKLEDLPDQCVFQICDVALALDLNPTAGGLHRFRFGFAAKHVGHFS